MIRTLAKVNNFSQIEAGRLKPSDYVLEMCLSAVESAQQINQTKKKQ